MTLECREPAPRYSIWKPAARIILPQFSVLLSDALIEFGGRVCSAALRSRFTARPEIRLWISPGLMLATVKSAKGDGVA